MASIVLGVMPVANPTLVVDSCSSINTGEIAETSAFFLNERYFSHFHTPFPPYVAGRLTTSKRVYVPVSRRTLTFLIVSY